LARKEAEARSECFDGSHRAYEEGDGALAHRITPCSWLTVELSEKGKVHDRAVKVYNSQAAEFVFRANNANAAPDEIDLHGLYIEEAAEVFETRVQACQQRREDHLHVYIP
jgi:hypothetical protein